MSESSSRVELGRINGAWGTAGWVRVFSLTEPPENIFEYQPWHTDGAPGLLRVCQWRRQGPRLMAELAGIENRDAAEALRGTRLFTDRGALPEPEAGSFYWHDLLGLAVVNRAGRALGRVSGFIDAGVHDVLQVRPESGESAPVLIPFVPDHYVLAVDLEAGRIEVDWEPEWLADETDG
jgi:16S rRNA processing protein RimM